MKLSIVTSYYNSERFIEQQSQSILSQSYQDWEWIICDDFSSDRTLELLKELAGKDSRIQLVTPKYKKEIWWNPQIYATGDIVVPIDGDDAILPGTFARIVYYFTKFPEIVLMHFNANKYDQRLPESPDGILTNYFDNVYISRDNSSFLDAFERLSPQRSAIFGYLRIWRNIPGIKFPVHEDGDSCSSNDGQWLLFLEESGPSLAIPRTTYLARQHRDSENFRNWNIRGEANLVTDAQKRREGLDLSMPRISDYFDEIYVPAESTYLSRLNWEVDTKRVAFFNFSLNSRQKLKLKELFYEHEILFDPDDKNNDYSFIRIKQDSDPELIMNLLSLASGWTNLYCDNVHLQCNNRTGINRLNEIRESIGKDHQYYWNVQENRAIISIMKELSKEGQELKSILLNGYENIPLNPQLKRHVGNECQVNFIDGPRVAINGPINAEYQIRFIDNDSGKEIYSTTIRNNCWAACSVKYAMDWRIEIDENSAPWRILKYEPAGKRVYIHLDSASLGDTLAWFPLVEEYRKWSGCHLICSTHRNYFFEGLYPEIEFVAPGTSVNSLYASFGIGWYYDGNGEIERFKNPYDFKQFPLQQTTSDILNMPFKEVKPLINSKNIGRTIPGDRPYICIAPHASALAKYWNLPGGWQGLINSINESGYDVVMITQEALGDQWHDSKLGGTLTGVIDKTGDIPLEDRINDLLNSSGFIGIGSGLSWLAYAVGTPVMMISGFSEEWTEFSDCIRIINNEGCRGCFNRERLRADLWDWCPDWRGTPRQFECTRSISLEQVIEGFKKLIKQ